MLSRIPIPFSTWKEDTTLLEPRSCLEIQWQTVNAHTSTLRAHFLYLDSFFKMPCLLFVELVVSMSAL